MHTSEQSEEYLHRYIKEREEEGGGGVKDTSDQAYLFSNEREDRMWRSKRTLRSHVPLGVLPGLWNFSSLSSSEEIYPPVRAVERGVKNRSSPDGADILNQ